MQRVIAPRRPTDIITTSSWRSGQQTVKRILGPARKKSSSPEGSRPQSRSSQGTDISEPKSLNFQWREEADGKKHAGVGDGSEKGGAPTDEVPRVTSPTNQKLVNGLKKDSGNRVNSLYSGHCGDLELVSSLARVHNSRSLFQSNICKLFLPGI